MLDWIRGARINMKTGLVIIALALAVWGIFVYASVSDFVPTELTEPTEPR